MRSQIQISSTNYNYLALASLEVTIVIGIMITVSTRIIYIRFYYTLSTIPVGSATVRNGVEDLSSFSRLFLNFPLRFSGIGLLSICWRIMILSSRSTSSTSRSASSCSRWRRKSSCIFCWRAARLSSSSRDLNSWTHRPTKTSRYNAIYQWWIQKYLGCLS